MYCKLISALDVNVRDDITYLDPLQFKYIEYLLSSPCYNKDKIAKKKI